MPLTEPVEIWSIETKLRLLDLSGKLFVGADGLPVLRVTEDAVEGEVHQVFRPATFPAVWSLRAPRNTWPGVLLDAWNKIEQIRGDIAFAERLEEARAEEEERDQEQQREINNRIAEELERQRGEVAGCGYD